MRDIRVRDSRNWRIGAGAYSMIADAAEITDDEQTIGRKRESPAPLGIEQAWGVKKAAGP